jgi:Na+/H+ antiporter NhaD/arsenite permease-like protein
VLEQVFVGSSSEARVRAALIDTCATPEEQRRFLSTATFQESIYHRRMNDDARRTDAARHGATAKTTRDAGSRPTLLRIAARVWRTLKRDYLLQVLLAAAVILTLTQPVALTALPALVDWPTIAALAGLLVLTKGVELSGFFHRVGFHLITLEHTERKLAFFLVASSALLSTVLTNDIALFIVVPLTLSLHGMAALPTTRLVVFEALAVNAGSALTPVGNPQNLFLWQRSGLSFHAFVGQMLPLAAILLAVLAVMTTVAFPARRVDATEDAEPPALDRSLLFVSVALYPLFIVIADLRHAVAGLLALLAVFVFVRRSALLRVDWALIVAFVLMFVDLRLVAQNEAVRDLVVRAGIGDPRHLYLAGVGISQLISNVPAAILLAEHSDDTRLIAYAVDVGGFGLVIGSLANLIALRMLRESPRLDRFSRLFAAVPGRGSRARVSVALRALSALYVTGDEACRAWHASCCNTVGRRQRQTRRKAAT